MTHEVHLKQVYHIFSYLRQHNNSRVVFELTCHVIDKDGFEDQDWIHVYDNAS